MNNHDRTKRFVAFVMCHTMADMMLWTRLEQCEYTAEYQGRRYRINCCPSNSFFVVDGEWLQISDTDIDNICCEIGKQHGRQFGGFKTMDTICGNWQPPENLVR